MHDRSEAKCVISHAMPGATRSMGEEAEWRVGVGALRRGDHVGGAAARREPAGAELVRRVAAAPEAGDHLREVVDVLPEPHHAVGVGVGVAPHVLMIGRGAAAPRPEAALRHHAAQVPGVVVGAGEEEVVAVPVHVQQRRRHAGAVGINRDHHRHRRALAHRRRARRRAMSVVVVVVVVVTVRANVRRRAHAAAVLHRGRRGGGSGVLRRVERREERRVVVGGVGVDEVGARLGARHGQRGAVVRQRRLLRRVERAQPVPLLGGRVAYLGSVPPPRPPPHAEEPPWLLRAPPAAPRRRPLAHRRRRRRRLARRLRRLRERHQAGLAAAAAAATAAASSVHAQCNIAILQCNARVRVRVS